MGRERELARLTSILSGGRPALLVGDAGSGKTRLAAELAAPLEDAGLLVFLAGCLPLASRLPLLPAVDLLRAFYARDGGTLLESALGDCPGYVRDDLTRVLPELGEPVESGLGAAWQQERLFAALTLLWQAVGRRRPWAVVIEDVHWSDQPTRDFLTYLLAHVRDGGLSLLLTSRPEEAEHEAAVRDWLSQLTVRNGVTRVALSPLSAENVAELAAALTGSPVSGPVTTELWGTDRRQRLLPRAAAGGRLVPVRCRAW